MDKPHGGRPGRPPKPYNWQRREWLLGVIALSGMRPSPFARACDLSDTTITQFLNGARPDISEATIRAICKTWNVPHPDRAPTGRIAVVGVVAAQANVVFAPTARPTKASVPCPTGYQPQELMALEVEEGTPYPPLAKGWIVFARRSTGAPTSDLAGATCVCKIAGNRTDEYLIRTLEPGRVPGTWDLHSPFAETIRGTGLEWAARVVLCQQALPDDE